ncbi:hypothetical protein [uncultured Cohaesibacter sp.]|uniref:hypothetical protein n=1 Tax=uncultured Cohaesibacter sp. TaxID=1002546 RepID=UPI0029C6F9FE|nr:hypothetical protein [uncultured Cohaesibacter sp.]
MKDLFISMGSDVCVQNFVGSTVQCRELQPDEVAGVIAATREQGGEITGFYKFASELSDENEHNFRQILVAMEAITGTRLNRECFFSDWDDDDDDDDGFPNINYMRTVTDTQSMLVVEYYFQLDLTDRDGELRKGEHFSVSTDYMTFYLFEHVAASQ